MDFKILVSTSEFDHYAVQKTLYFGPPVNIFVLIGNASCTPKLRIISSKSLEFLSPPDYRWLEFEGGLSEVLKWDDCSFLVGGSFTPPTLITAIYPYHTLREVTGIKRVSKLRKFGDKILVHTLPYTVHTPNGDLLTYSLDTDRMVAKIEGIDLGGHLVASKKCPGMFFDTCKKKFLTIKTNPLEIIKNVSFTYRSAEIFGSFMENGEEFLVMFKNMLWRDKISVFKVCESQIEIVKSIQLNTENFKAYTCTLMGPICFVGCYSSFFELGGFQVVGLTDSFECCNKIFDKRRSGIKRTTNHITIAEIRDREVDLILSTDKGRVHLVRVGFPKKFKEMRRKGEQSKLDLKERIEWLREKKEKIVFTERERKRMYFKAQVRNSVINGALRILFL